ncbi:MAG TPA: MerR family transcriptional regulator [Actinomycetota bacterium]|nr:MerR family transcriptional regulator [Actinomycetota bacterium]
MDDATMTIEELAARTGMTVRNIRAHQTRGLLPAPVVRARTGYYGPEHVARLELIREMQGAGFNLNAIRHVLEMAPPGTGEELLRFERSLMAPWEDEQPEAASAADLAERFGELDPRALEKAIALGVLRDLGNGNFEVLSPALLRAGEEVVALGIPLEHALAVVEKVQRHAKGVAKEFVRLFVQDVWRPFKDAGLPEDRLPEMRKSLEKLRSLASDVVLTSFRLTMAAETERAFGKELEKPLAKRGRRAS